jgi:hypothetical protein
MIEALLLLLVNPQTSPRTEEFVFKYMVKEKFKTYKECTEHVEKMKFYKEGKTGVYVVVENKERQVAATACYEKKK